MSPITNVDHALFIDLWPYIVVAFGNQCKRSYHIQLCNCLCCSLYPGQLCCDSISHLTVKLIFQCTEFILCSQNRIFQLFQFWNDITLRIGKGLLSCIIIRNQIFGRIGNFQIITEYFIITDTQVFNPGLFPFLGLQISKPVLSFGFCFSKTIHFFIITVFDDSAFFHGKRRFFLNRPSDQITKFFQRIQFFINFF